MSDEDTPKITDPTRIRALAHPLRMELIDLLSIEGEATATRCAELTGQSVASCSFHLRILAKYGFIELGQPRGREKPWRLITRSRTVSADFDDPSSVRALVELATLDVEREAERLRLWIARAVDEPREWIDASVLTTSTFWATADELKQISADLAELTSRFKQRWDDPSTRPPGARVARMFGATTVDPERGGQR